MAEKVLKTIFIGSKEPFVQISVARTNFNGEFQYHLHIHEADDHEAGVSLSPLIIDQLVDGFNEIACDEQALPTFVVYEESQR